MMCAECLLKKTSAYDVYRVLQPRTVLTRAGYQVHMQPVQHAVNLHHETIHAGLHRKED